MTQPEVTVYSKSWCPYCVRAKQLLRRLDVTFTDIDVEQHPERYAEMVARARRTTVPQIWIGDTHVGGCDELYALQRANALLPLLADKAAQ